MSKNYAKKVIKIAKGEIGYLEKKSNSNLDNKTANAGFNDYTKYARDFDTKYPDFYNGKKNGYYWCDMFVDWCMVQAFGVATALELLGQPKKSCGAGCQFSANYYKQMNRFYNSPKVGDQIFFKGSDGKPCHTGLVYKVDNTYVYTIEGNTSSASGVVANGGCVAEKKYAKTSSYIYGYGRPDYDEKPVKIAKKVNYKVEFIKKSKVFKKANKNSKVVKTIKRGKTRRIVKEKNGFGKLRSGNGWIKLKNTKKVR